MDDVPGGTVAPGQSVDVTWRYRVPDDTTSMRFFGEVTGAHFFQTTGSTGERYETRQPIPIWDLWVQSAITIESEADDGTIRLRSRVTVENRGTVDTPGPVHLFIDHQEPGVGILGGWNGLSAGPVPAGGTIQIDGGSPLQGTRPFDDDRLESGVQVIAACPDGSSGELSDANRADNVRTLRQNGQPAPTAGS